MGKQNGKSASLDAKIATALSNDNISLSELRTLLAEAEQTRSDAKKTVEIESEAALNPTNDDPDSSDRRLWRAQRCVARLDQAVPQLQAKVKRLEMVEYKLAWHEKADALEKERDDLAAELCELYPSFIQEIAELYAAIDKNSAEIDKLHMSAPTGEHRRLIDAELRARNLPYHDAAHPRLRDNLKLPNWDISRTISFPPHVDWSERAALANEAMVQRMKEKFGAAYNSSWASARELAIQQEEAEHGRRSEELQAKQLAEKAIYEQKLREMK